MLQKAGTIRIPARKALHCSLGTWLDWEAQGTRVSGNIYCENDRDLMIEVTHGPCLVDNNIFTASFTLVNAAQGTAFVHHLISGFMDIYPVLDRATPYHLPHSTTVLGTALTYGGDDRWYNNLFVGGGEETRPYGTGWSGRVYGTDWYDGSPVPLEDMMGAERPACPAAGPVEHMRPGINKIPVWEQPGIRNNADGKMEIYE